MPSIIKQGHWKQVAGAAWVTWQIHCDVKGEGCRLCGSCYIRTVQLRPTYIAGQTLYRYFFEANHNATTVHN